jgi:hypothetical protein
MSDDEKPGTGTDIDLTVAQQISLKPGMTLADVMADLFALKDKALIAASGTSDLAMEADLSDIEVASMEELRSLMEEQKFPVTAREATEDERAWMIAVRNAASTVYKMAERIRDKQVKPAAHNHFDRVAEREGLVNENTLRTKDGHYVIEDKSSFRVPEEERTIHRIYKRGSASYGQTLISGEKLLELYESGEITRAQYLRWTEATRVLREDRILEDGQKDPEVFAVLAKITTTTSPTVSIQAAKNADEESK